MSSMTAAGDKTSATASNPGNTNSDGTTSFHAQVTLPSDVVGKQDTNGIFKDSRSVNGTAVLRNIASSANPSRDVSPNKQSPSTAPKQQSSLRSSATNHHRYHEPPSVEASPIAPRMSTVPEDDIADGEGRASKPTRKSVQFTRDAPDTIAPEQTSHTPNEDEKIESARTQSLYSRLRALASSQGLTHIRSSSGISTSARSMDGRDGEASASVLGSGNRETALEATFEDDEDDNEGPGCIVDADDADEESAAEGAMNPIAPKKRKRKLKRHDDIETAPSSPRSSHPTLSTSLTPQPHQASSLFSISRRATDSELSPGRAGVSEDEGRKQFENSPGWSPRHPLRNISYGGIRNREDGNTSAREFSRPRNLLSLNTGSSVQHQEVPGSATDTPKISRRKILQERGTTLSAAKWRQIKNSLKAFGTAKKKDPTPDQAKSAELLAELQAGGPAALMLASMFQRDEHGSRRIPALLEQLKVSVTDSEIDKYKEPGNPTPNDKHIIFRIELEYGSGTNRMKWVIRRSLRDFANLHAKYKLHYQSEKLKGRGDNTQKMPKFPRKVFPWLKGVKGLDEEDDDEDMVDPIEPVLSDTERPGLRPQHSTRPSVGSRRRSSVQGTELTPTTPGGTLLWSRHRGTGGTEKDINFPQRQRKMLEVYLQGMIKFMLFKADANRLCKFLEISAMGMRLASEASFHGKEGFLIIRSAKGLDFRKTLTPNNLKSRHTPKWFLVRHSYIVCVDSPEAMHVYDVFLFDPDFFLQSSKPVFREPKEKREIGRTAKEIAASSKEIAKHPQHHRLKLQNSERKLKLLARNERVLHQFEESIRQVTETSPWCRPNRFDSFAPVRHQCFAQWLVDGRDHMWVVSRALNQAKDVIYIHDWWLSPELYMRRPPAISQKWRLDRLLKRKAEEGVKIFIIVYRNIDAAVPIDSQYTKFSLLDLHPNIFVQRSPNQFRQNTFFWAHHEKLCVVDHTIAFVGGIDLCFGRWDTPQHILVDDKSTGFEESEGPKDADHCQLWPGKDYSNPRVQDFFQLNKPYEEMYNRSEVARMPWHDISMQIVGQPARDLTRHFVQRWNYILRQRKPTRPTPFLLPPPDFVPADLEALGLDGTCEVQLLRSAGPWSIGTPDKTEHSIMNAYIKMIEESEHFVYIENQFFITSCETEGATVFNKIGDALVERITRAANNDESWRAVIVIPLIPGFQNTVEEEGGTSVRLIMQYQYRSICRGESSIFGRLKALGIEPEDYIQFYSLRQWGKIGPRNSLVTEQLYIHAKCIIVDDRVALIGSANINERSQLGNRDSEVAAVVRDTDMLWSKMDGKPYRVGRFAHSLRMRLMREHLGLDVDQIMEEAQMVEADRRKSEGKAAETTSPRIVVGEEEEENPFDVRGREMTEDYLNRNEGQHTFNHDVDWEQAGNPNLKANRKVTEDSRVTGTEAHRKDVSGEGFDNMAAFNNTGLGSGRDTMTLRAGKEVLLADLDTEGKRSLREPRKHGDVPRLPSYVMKIEAPEPPMPPRPAVNRMHTEDLGLTMLSQLPALPDLDDSDIGGPALEDIAQTNSNGSWSRHHFHTDLKFPLVDRDCMSDPIADTFLDETWHSVAENNTKIYRAVFRCMPDNLVRDWNDYHQYVAYEQRFQQLQGQGAEDPPRRAPESAQHQNKRAGPPGVGASTSVAAQQLKSLTKVPTDIAKAAEDVKEKLAVVMKDKHDKQDPNPESDNVDEKEVLRNWAKDTNHAQMKRTGTDLTIRASTDGTQALQTVPEDDPVHHAGGSEESTTVATSDMLDGPGDAVPNIDDLINNNYSNVNSTTGTVRRRRRGTTRSSRRDFSAADDMMPLAEAEDLLGKIQGHLIEWPYDWLEKVEAGGNWLFPFDQISPIEIYI